MVPKDQTPKSTEEKTKPNDDNADDDIADNDSSVEEPKPKNASSEIVSPAEFARYNKSSSDTTKPKILPDIDASSKYYLIIQTTATNYGVSLFASVIFLYFASVVSETAKYTSLAIQLKSTAICMIGIYLVTLTLLVILLPVKDLLTIPFEKIMVRCRFLPIFIIFADFSQFLPCVRYEKQAPAKIFLTTIKSNQY